jgi:hypothetical protein
MSTAVDSESVPGTVTHAPDEEIRVFGHSNLVYWWPVWLLGFVMAGLTYADGHVMAIVPPGTQVESEQVLPGHQKPRDVLVAPPGQAVPPLPGSAPGEFTPRLRVSTNNSYGVVFIGVLLLVIIITNFVLRGLVSVLVIALIAIVLLVLALFDWWNPVLAWLGGLDVRMNAEGYLVIAVPLFIIWLFSTFVYDRYTYLVVTRGQARIRQAIGDGELAVDTAGLVLDKKRNDLFRHWLLGLGSGDLHVKTGGPANLDFELHNVMFIGAKIRRIQDLLREKEVSEQAPGT